ncbi:MAG TPA: hypothetical protein DCF89_03815 [Flavobacteriales bacterium]|nr:hypothetical protein [Flavobacteriales bacterium]
MNKVELFFEKVKTIGFWNRLFGWSEMRTLSYEAIEELIRMTKDLEELRSNVAKLEKSEAGMLEKISGLEENVSNAKLNDARRESEWNTDKESLARIQQDRATLTKKLAEFQALEEQKTKTYHKNVEKLNHAYDQLKTEKERLNDARVEEQRLELENMKTTWQQHEKDIEQEIKRLCAKHTITYLDSVPFRGKPDNPVEICEEVIVFDAKSPRGEELGNFPTYIKNQAEQASKYVKHKSVKKEIYLVIPSNTVRVIDKFHYQLGSYDVFVITKDALEPVLLSLKKIEEYEFADKLSPEDRSALCRIIGKFAHTTKRRVQIDQFMANHMLELLRLAESELPEEFVGLMKDFEKAEKLNPSTERRNKEIDISKLSDEHSKINAQAEIRELIVPKSLDDIE